METDIQTMRIKIMKEKKVKDKDKNKVKDKDKKNKEGAPPPEDMNSDATHHTAKSSEKKSKNKKRNKTSKNPSLYQIGQSAGDNCCACCRAMIQYLQEVCKLIWCLTGVGTEKTRVAEVLCEMIEITCNIGRDCIDLFKYICRWILPK